MNSVVLKNQLNEFISSCDNNLEKHQEIIKKLGLIESLLSNNHDKLLNNYLLCTNEIITKRLIKLDQELDESKKVVLRTMNDKIDESIKEERLYSLSSNN